MITKSASTIPGVMSYLVLRCSTLMEDVLVTDGQPVPPQDSEPDLLCIGFTGTLGEPAIESTRLRQQAAAYPDRETYEITCLASSWKGNEGDPEAVRNGCFDIIDRMASILAQDQTLGGNAMTCRILTDGVAQEQTEMGAVATVRFVVQVTAFTR